MTELKTFRVSKPSWVAALQITHCGDEVVWSYHQKRLVLANGPHDTFEARSEHDSWDDAFEASKKHDVGPAGFNELSRQFRALRVAGKFFADENTLIQAFLRDVGPAGVAVRDPKKQGSTEPGELLVCVPAKEDMVPSKSL